MTKKSVLLFLLAFVTITLFIDFFHTDRFLRAKESCPVCHFQGSTASTGQHELCDYLLAPELRLLERLFISECSDFQQVSLDHPSSRAPPPA